MYITSLGATMGMLTVIKRAQEYGNPMSPAKIRKFIDGGNAARARAIKILYRMLDEKTSRFACPGVPKP